MMAEHPEGRFRRIIRRPEQVIFGSILTVIEPIAERISGSEEAEPQAPQRYEIGETITGQARQPVRRYRITWQEETAAKPTRTYKEIRAEEVQGRLLDPSTPTAEIIDTLMKAEIPSSFAGLQYFRVMNQELWETLHNLFQKHKTRKGEYRLDSQQMRSHWEVVRSKPTPKMQEKIDELRASFLKLNELICAGENPDDEELWTNFPPASQSEALRLQGNVWHIKPKENK